MLRLTRRTPIPSVSAPMARRRISALLRPVNGRAGGVVVPVPDPGDVVVGPPTAVVVVAATVVVVVVT
jgi:hypothetical protein